MPPEVDDPHIRFVVGRSQATLRGFDPKHPLVMHLDADLNSSALVHLNPILVPGSVPIFDEFNDLAQEFSAWRDFCRACQREGRVLYAHRSYRQLAIGLV